MEQSFLFWKRRHEIFDGVMIVTAADKIWVDRVREELERLVPEFKIPPQKIISRPRGVNAADHKNSSIARVADGWNTIVSFGDSISWAPSTRRKHRRS